MNYIADFHKNDAKQKLVLDKRLKDVDNRNVSLMNGLRAA